MTTTSKTLKRSNNRHRLDVSGRGRYQKAPLAAVVSSSSEAVRPRSSVNSKSKKANKLSGSSHSIRELRVVNKLSGGGGGLAHRPRAMSSGGGFTLVDFTIPTRKMPKSHPPAEAPLCDECRANDLYFFDPNCGGCQDILLHVGTTISQLFAVMRQWVPQTQRNMSHLAREVLRRGANVNDKDDLTDLSLLHYACKCGAVGLGKEDSAANLVNSLISKGADVEMRCQWTDMNALHYAVFFDVAEVVHTLAKQCPGLLVSTCSEFSGGTPLHIAAANVCLKSAKALLSHKADGGLKDSEGRCPHECVPEDPPNKLSESADELRGLLKQALDERPVNRNIKASLCTCIL